MKNTKHYHCPVNGWDCPCYVDSAVIAGEEEYNLCGMGLPHPEQHNLDPDVFELNPYEECDDFFSMWGEDCNPDDYTDYVEE